MRGASAAEISPSWAKRRFRRDDFFSRMWLRLRLRRTSLPVPVVLMRFFAPLCVFIFGMCCAFLREHGPPGDVARRHPARRGAPTEWRGIARPGERVWAWRLFGGCRLVRRERDIGCFGIDRIGLNSWCW